MSEFDQEVIARLSENGRNPDLRNAAHQFMIASILPKYSYNFSWLGRPIIQLPQDVVAMQELVWKVKPDLIIETGIAHGGSLIFSASMLALLEYCDALTADTVLDPAQPTRTVLAVDIDIRAHNRVEIERHPMSNRIQMIQGSSIDRSVIDQVKERAAAAKRIMVCLDSNHTHDHVLAELDAYASLVSVGSYCVVLDTFDIPKTFLADRPWGPGNNAGTAVEAFLQTHDEFEIDRSIDHKLQISSAPGGYLKRTK